MIARVPASTANIGPGFDTLALAVSLYLEVESKPSTSFQVTAYGQGREGDAGPDHLGARVAEYVLGHSNVHLTVRSQIPLGRGLGSSAAFVAACAAALEAEDPFQVACHFDGHPENAAASVFGGFVTATRIGEDFISTNLPLDPELALVAVIPDRELATKSAREVLPNKIPFSDASFNLGRFGLLVAGFGDMNHLMREATDDRLHQDYRKALFPESSLLIEVLIGSGSICACWSGAGPTMVGFCHKDDSEAVALRAKTLLSDQGYSYSVQALQVDNKGLVTSMSYRSGFEPLEVASL